jgi:hypothetical protein
VTADEFGTEGTGGVHGRAPVNGPAKRMPSMIVNPIASPAIDLDVPPGSTAQAMITQTMTVVRTLIVGLVARATWKRYRRDDPPQTLRARSRTAEAPGHPGALTIAGPNRR